MKSISIISLGWLGSSLYDFLELRGHKVAGTYNSTPKNKRNEYLYNYQNSVGPKDVVNSDVVIINLTPSVLKSTDLFKRLLESIPKKIIFISSTSVYGQSGVLNEKHLPKPVTDNGKLLLKLENILLERDNSSIIRPAGLYGEDRHPGLFLSGKTSISNPDAPVNLISRKDLLEIIYKCIEEENHKIINAVNINHPGKKIYYQGYCERSSLALPEFKDTSSASKVVESIYPEFIVNTPLP